MYGCGCISFLLIYKPIVHFCGLGFHEYITHEICKYELWRLPVLIYRSIFSWPKSPSWATQHLAQNDAQQVAISGYCIGPSHPPQRCIRIMEFLQAAFAFSVFPPAASPPWLRVPDSNSLPPPFVTVVVSQWLMRLSCSV